jgi:hypothetical protein
MKLFRRRIKTLIIGLIFLSVILSNIFGLFIHPFEIDFETNFSYPLDINNLRDIIESLKDKQLLDSMPKSIVESFKDKQPLDSMPKPINDYNYRFIIRNQNKCSKINSINNQNNRSHDNEEDVTLLIVVKSALKHFDRRNAIRKSWGFEKRFSDVVIRKVFILGNCVDRTDINDCQDLIDDEFNRYKDIVQADFEDTYYNNTIKTMIAFKWIVEHCMRAQFILFVDDDYYVSIKNLLKFIRNPTNASPLIDSETDTNKLNEYQFDGRLYSGYVFSSSTPMRHKMSKWFVSLQEYPYSYYPPYVTAGAFVLSNLSLLDMYFASFYTKHFRFDDIYIGILAKKVSIIPLHNENFYFWKLKYDPNVYANVIASHGFSDSNELMLVWNQQKTLGNA